MTEIAFALRGPGGEPVDLWRTFLSRGVAELPPLRIDDASRSMEMTLPIDGVGPRTLTVSERGAQGIVAVTGRRPGSRQAAAILTAVRHVLRMDEDLSGFYARVARDPALSWAAAGAGRMVRSQTVFEDVVKTICTTNCAWSATERMVRALVGNLGRPAPGAPADGWRGRCFPTPSAMGEADERFYRDVVRAGYRSPYLVSLARSVAEGAVDLEAWAGATPDELPDDELERRLLALPGVGPYAAAHILTMSFGRYSRLILDSWSRPTYARLVRRASIQDDVIRRRFSRYGRFAGLAFWLFLTRSWVEEQPRPAQPGA